MTTMQELFLRLRQEQKLKSLYRFQGKADTTSNRKIFFNSTGQNFTFGNECTYFSRELSHHKYFSQRRMRQMINQVLSQKDIEPLSNNILRDNQQYEAIKKTVVDSKRVLLCESIQVLITPALNSLLRSSYVLQKNCGQNHNACKIPELSDFQVFGGAFGLSGEWLNLLSKLTLFIGRVDIENDDLLQFLYQLRLNLLSVSKVDITSFINRKTPTVIINDDLYNSYHKNAIIESAEIIVEQGIFPSGSPLNTKPNQTIHGMIAEYTKLREEILRSLESSNNRKFNI